MTPIAMELSGGARSEARLFEAPAPRAALLVVPAMGVDARKYDAFGEALAARGVTALVSELRGGESSTVKPRRGVDYGYEELLGDTVTHLKWLRENSGLPTHVLGHSLGGQISVAGVARWHEPGAKVIVVGSGTVHFRAYEGLEKWRVLAGTQFASVVSQVLGFFPGDRLGFGGVQGKRLIVDWAHASRTGTFRFERELEKFSPRVLAIHVKGDTFAPRRSTERLVGKLVNAQVSWAEVEPPAEPKRQDPHFRWMRDPRAVAEAAADFLTT